jgi:uncharacterized OB-fold protein
MTAVRAWTTGDSAPFWAAAARCAIAINRCARCKTVLHLPEPLCFHCGSLETEWVDTSGRGRLYSFTVVERAMGSALPAPYTVVLVELEDYPQARLVGSLPGRAKLSIGEPMEAFFELVDDVHRLPQWRPTSIPGTSEFSANASSPDDARGK